MYIWFGNVIEIRSFLKEVFPFSCYFKLKNWSTLKEKENRRVFHLRRVGNYQRWVTIWTDSTQSKTWLPKRFRPSTANLNLRQVILITIISGI